MEDTVISLPRLSLTIEWFGSFFWSVSKQAHKLAYNPNESGKQTKESEKCSGISCTVSNVHTMNPTHILFGHVFVLLSKYLQTFPNECMSRPQNRINLSQNTTMTVRIFVPPPLIPLHDNATQWNISKLFRFWCYTIVHQLLFCVGFVVIAVVFGTNGTEMCTFLPYFTSRAQSW